MTRSRGWSEREVTQDRVTEAPRLIHEAHVSSRDRRTWWTHGTALGQFHNDPMLTQAAETAIRDNIDFGLFQYSNK